MPGNLETAQPKTSGHLMSYDQLPGVARFWSTRMKHANSRKLCSVNGEQQIQVREQVQKAGFWDSRRPLRERVVLEGVETAYMAMGRPC